ncbi:MAG TPA: hypothetical protein VKE22_29880 [Haliangiales bacterium]|nr:hypothetical protein [Haliangiales bacterium]
MRRLASLLFLAACGTTITAVPTNRPLRVMSPRDPMSVEMFTSGIPQRPYVEVAYLESQQESDLSFDNAPTVMMKMREEAGKMGCDGLIIGGANDAVVGGTFRGTGSTTTLRGYRGTCIQWTDGPQAAAPVAPPVANQ